MASTSTCSRLHPVWSPRRVPELAHAISSGRTGEAEATRLRQAFRERFCPHDDGRASERVVRRVFPAA
ncbi:CDP-glycerol glycerophosphotransferase family protein [Streptomyces sp. NPDC018026]|uniref:CDP-glycerol glycerophosphotransferase family protein n=1 Tax=Streptomyces sp. NPDC018026 TaxID=3365031 RepID=UPI0037A21F48